MSLHVESCGKGAPLLLIHGWGMHGGVWEGVARKLSANFRVHTVDLPGYGFSKASSERSVESGKLAASIPLATDYSPLTVIADQLSAQFSEPLAVCGWSLGGQVALHWAKREPAKVQRLILVTSTPCFTRREDWLFGMEGEVFEKFAAELEQNHAATLRRFIALQLRGSENERELLTELRGRLFSRGEPDMDSLRSGLGILRDADQRADLHEIKQRALVIAGERDKLTPPEASRFLAQVMSSARLVEIAGAAHVPFLSHPELFVEQVKSFLHE